MAIDNLRNVENAERGLKKGSMLSEKLKLGILLDSLKVPAWAADAIQRIAAGNSAEFALLIMNDAGSTCRRARRRTWLYSTFSWVDQRLFSKPPDPFTPTGITGLLSDVPEIRVLPVEKGDLCILQESDVARIREHRLDILVRIGFENLQCDSPHLSKYGTWYYYHGDDTRMSGGPPGFWEVVENRPETDAALLAAGGEGFSKRVLYRSHFLTHPVSPARNRSLCVWAAAPFLARQIELLQRLGAGQFWRQTEKFNARSAPAAREYDTPTGLLAAISIAKITLKLLKEFLNRLFYFDQWFLLLSLKKGISDGFSTFDVLRPPKDRFWADPHVAQLNGNYYIFIEEFLRAKKKGHISVIELDEFGNWRRPVKVLEKSYHLSYPFVLEWNGRFYMVPESGKNRTIDLYESVEFPYIWKLRRTLIENVRAVDTELVYFSAKWWLFTAIAENEAAAPNVELFLFYSEDLLTGKWQAHPQNPIVSDVKCARPAGSLFVKDGRLFRPSQYCSRRYGYGFDLNEITVLSESEYCENKALSVRPDWDKEILATHTYANRGKLTVIDACTRAGRIG